MTTVRGLIAALQMVPEEFQDAAVTTAEGTRGFGGADGPELEMKTDICGRKTVNLE